MRIGVSIDREILGRNLQEWIVNLDRMNCNAVSCPFDYTWNKEERREVHLELKKRNITIAEVGIWNNTISEDKEKRKKAIQIAAKQLHMADEEGILCCVNGTGNIYKEWDEIGDNNLDNDKYELIVDTIREIIDEVQPGQTFYTVEPLPWSIPNSPEMYLKLLKDVDRKAFAVHLDYTNMINSTEKYMRRNEFIRYCFKLLGPNIKGIHSKDIIMVKSLPCHIKEVIPGEGKIDFKVVFECVRNLNLDIPILVEHLSSIEQYRKGLNYLNKYWKKWKKVAK